jgi:hypothetical protein
MLSILSLVFGVGVATPVALSAVGVPGADVARMLVVGDAVAQQADLGLQNGVSNGGNGGTSRSGRGGASGPGGDGGLAVVHDVGTAEADALSAVIIDEITTGDVEGHAIQVDARGATRPVVVSVAGSFGDTGVDIFAPGGNAQAGTTGGNSSGADASGGASGDGGHSGNASSRGGDGGVGPSTGTLTVSPTP